YCWGANGAGHLGDATHIDRPTPVPVSGAYQFSKIEVGANHTCALDTDQYLYCWGYNGSGQAGQGSGSNSSYSAPQRISGYKFTDIAVGATHTCAIATGGVTYCWGQGDMGQIGNSKSKNQFAPVEVDTAEEFVGLAA